MQQLIELLQQIQDLAGVAIDALQEAGGGGGGPEAGGGGTVPTAPEGAPQRGGPAGP